jgi:hypothetical protein
VRAKAKLNYSLAAKPWTPTELHSYVGPEPLRLEFQKMDSSSVFGQTLRFGIHGKRKETTPKSSPPRESFLFELIGSPRARTHRPQQNG